MIPSDHFVRFYNEVFKALERKGHEHLVAYWRQLGRVQGRELTDKFRAGGLQACYDYWKRILKEEDCKGHLTLTDDYFEFRMDRCPSLAKVLDNDAAASELYCDHCAGWVEPVIKSAGMHVVCDMESRTEPHCVLRVYRDKSLASEYERQARLPSHPYASSAGRKR